MEFWRAILTMAGIPLGCVLAYVAAGKPGYIPDAALQGIAQRATSPGEARAAMLRALRGCFRASHLTPDDVGSRLSVVYSWQNDRGYLARTQVLCSAQGCSVEGRALIAHAQAPERCTGTRRAGSFGRGRIRW